MKILTLLIPVLFLITFFITMGGMPLAVKSAGEINDRYVVGKDDQDTFPVGIVSAVWPLSILLSNDEHGLHTSENYDHEDFHDFVSSGASGFLVANESIVRDTYNNNAAKAVVLAFDDGWKSQYLYAKPILDEFGFKATFFITCNFATEDDSWPYMSWKQIKNLQQDGHDIESHSMNHRKLTELSTVELEYEVGESKKCLHERGINATIFATPYNAGWDDGRVIDSLARHYDLAKNGNEDMMYLYCDGWSGGRYTNQTDCRTYDEDKSDSGNSTKTPNFVNRYSIRAWGHNYYDQLYAQDQAKIFEAFVKAVNRPASFNKNGEINAIVVLEYHRVNEIQAPLNTDIQLFYAEMKYLHDNGFIVLTMSDLGYDDARNYLFIKNK